ncbi:hypothetical protein F5Y10DRAFT_291014 [Nemania abortiva]|nr:hypothetical protein F5Y10DRAFT_291014 [Nemania abortiva]
MSSITAEQLRSAKPLVNYAGEEKDFTVWDANRETLERLFITENCILKIVKQRMEAEYGFPTFPLINYETTLRDRYNFRKKLKKTDWSSIGFYVEKRKLHGKASHVYFGGILQEPRKVEKEVRRYAKRSVLHNQIRSNCASPPLRQTIAIRTPPPEAQSDGDITMIRAPSAVDIAVRSQWIDNLRLQSPFTKFISLLMSEMMPNTPITTAIEIARCISVPTIGSSPSLSGGSDLASLSYSCFILSNNLDHDSIFTKSLLKWIEISAEISVLKSFFSIKSFTTRSVWDTLYLSSVRLRQFGAYSILVELGLSMEIGDWLTQRSSCLVDAVDMKATDTVKALLKKPGIDPNSVAFRDETSARLLMPWVENYLVSPLAMAAYDCDLDMIKILLTHGATVNPPLAQDWKGLAVHPLFAALRSGLRKGERRLLLDSLVRCTYALLDAGSDVDIYDELGWRRQTSRWGWYEPQYPSWLVDYAWKRFPTEASFITKLFDRSLKAQSEVTVAGVCIAANQGPKHVRQYLASRRLPLGENRTAILQIAISEAAAYGLSGPVGCLLQLGVDPNVKYIERGFSSDCDHRDWHPVVRAAHGQHHHVLAVLRSMGTYSQPLLIVKRFFNAHRDATPTSDSNISVNAALSLVRLFRPEIEEDGRSLILLFLKSAYQENFSICAKVCEMAWSWGAPRVIGDLGRDALHYAIFYSCCLDMIKFLMARGYRVHSKLAYDYGYCLDHLSAEETRFPSYYPRSSMLGDALTSYSNDRLAIINLLLDEGAETTGVNGHHTLLELVFARAFSAGNRIDTIEIFKKLFYANAPVNRPPQQVPSRSILTSLIGFDADDSLIFQVIDATRDIDECIGGYVPLLAAIAKGRLAIAKRLLDRGAKVNNVAYVGRSTPLAIACGATDIPLGFIEDLIKRGADINPQVVRQNSRTPLHAAAETGKLNVAALLLKHGADVNVACKFSEDFYYTPLDIATMEGKLDMVHLLRSLGGKSWDQGMTGFDGAIAHARIGGYYAIAEFLSSSF